MVVVLALHKMEIRAHNLEVLVAVLHTALPVLTLVVMELEIATELMVLSLLRSDLVMLVGLLVVNHLLLVPVAVVQVG